MPDALFQPIPDAFDPKLPPIQQPPAAAGGAFPQKAETENPPLKTPFKYPRRLVFSLAAGISSAAALVSAWNAFEWLATVRPPFVALPMALIAVGAGILFPDFAIILWRSRKRAMAAFVMAAGLVGIGICMFSTVAALYNGRQSRLDSSSEARMAASALPAALEEGGRLRAEVVRLDGLIDSTQGKIDGISAEDTLRGYSQTLQTRLLGYRDERKGYEEKVAANEARVADLRKATESGQRDIYAFLAGRTGAATEDIELLTVAIPAVFLDLVAPVMVALMLFL